MISKSLLKYKKIESKVKEFKKNKKGFTLNARKNYLSVTTSLVRTRDNVELFKKPIKKIALVLMFFSLSILTFIIVPPIFDGMPFSEFASKFHNFWNYNPIHIRPGGHPEDPNFYWTIWLTLENTFIAIVDSFKFTLVAVFLGITLSIPLAMLSSMNVVNSKPIVATTRGIVTLLRVLPILMIGLVINRVFYSESSAVIILTLFVTSIFTKWLYEDIGDIDKEVILSMKAFGLSKFSIFTRVVAPQILKRSMASGFYMLEITFRFSAILGFFGLPGIGYIWGTILFSNPGHWGHLLVVIIIFACVITSLNWMNKILMKYIINYKTKKIFSPFKDASIEASNKNMIFASMNKNFNKMKIFAKHNFNKEKARNELNSFDKNFNDLKQINAPITNVLQNKPIIHKWISVVLLIIIITLISISFVDINWGLRPQHQIDREFSDLAGLLTPKWSILSEWGSANNPLYTILDGFWIVLGVFFFALMFSMPIGLLASKKIGGKYLSVFFRGLITFMRAIPGYIFTSFFFLFSISNYGAFAAVLGLGLASSRSIGNRILILVDNLENNFGHSIIASGGSKFDFFRYALLPKILPEIISRSTYLIEINFKNLLVIGAMGMNVFGNNFQTKMANGIYDETVIYIGLFVIITLFIEFSTSLLRKQIHSGTPKPIFKTFWIKMMIIQWAIKYNSLLVNKILPLFGANKKINKILLTNEKYRNVLLKIKTYREEYETTIWRAVVKQKVNNE